MPSGSFPPVGEDLYGEAGAGARPGSGNGQSADRLYLVRHGETELSARHAYSGRLDVPLTARGRQQARTAARLLDDAGIDVVYTSPLARAMETARAIATAAGAALEVDARLMEVDYGPLEGLDREAARAEVGAAYDAWRQDPMGSPVPGVEPLADALVRMTQVTRRAVDGGGRPVLVSHQGVLRLVLIALGRLDAGDYFATEFVEAEPLEILAPRLVGDLPAGRA